MQVYTQAGRINYSPNSAGEPSVAGGDARQKLFGRFRTESGTTVRARASSFADHYSQARLFYQSQTTTEQGHIISALIVELSQVDGVAIRQRMIGHLLVINEDLATRVANGLGLDASSIDPATPLSTPISYNDTYPSLSILLSSSNGTLLGRHIGCIIGADVDESLVSNLRSSITGQDAKVTFLSRTLSTISFSSGDNGTDNGNSTDSDVTPDGLYSTMSSALFDSVLILLDNNTTSDWLGDSQLVSWVSDAYNHLKVIGYVPGAQALLTQAV
jgi:catalase